MNNKDNRIYEMCLRVQESRTALAEKIPADSYASQLFERLGQRLDNLDVQTSEHSSRTRAVAESGMAKDATRTTLRQQLNAIGHTAKPMEKTTPGIAEKFRIPTRLKDQDLLRLARAIASDVLPFKTEFIKRGLASSFVEDLLAAAANFEQAISRKILNTESKVASHANVKGLLRECSDIVRELDPIIRNICAGDPGALAIWESASHVERTTRRNQQNGQPPA